MDTERCIQVARLCGGKWERNIEESRRVYSVEALSPTIPTAGGGNHEPKILKPRVLGGYGNRCNNDTQWHQQNRIYDNEVAISVTTDFQPNYIDNEIRIRKLTPKECFRLMGFDDEDYEKAAKVNSESQLYKRAGNSIVVDVLEALFSQLKPYFKEDSDPSNTDVIRESRAEG